MTDLRCVSFKRRYRGRNRRNCGEQQLVYGEGSGSVVKLLALEPRFVLQKVTTLSVPIAALCLAAVGRLEAAKKLPIGTAAAATLRDWFRQDMEAAWEKLLRENGRTQGALPLGSADDELPLGER